MSERLSDDRYIASRDRFPRLGALRLSDGDYESLATQGFVSRERLPSGRICFKLRFRRNPSKCQSVRYIGTNAAVAGEVRRELAELQMETREHRELKRLRREAFKQLRATKRRLMAILGREGVEFHGFEP